MKKKLYVNKNEVQLNALSKLPIDLENKRIKENDIFS